MPWTSEAMRRIHWQIRAGGQARGDIVAFGALREFVSEAKRVLSLEALGDLLDAASHDLGFDYFGLTHHVDFLNRPSATVGLGNYPVDWVEAIKSNRYYADDPVHLACQRSVVGFSWDELPKLIAMSERHHTILAEAAIHGVGDGFTVPVHIPGEFAGSTSFAARRGRRLPVDFFSIGQWTGSFAFETARRIARAEAERSGHSPVRLSQRQIECVTLACQGKSEGVIAAILGLSRETVHTHLEIAKRRWGISTRQQLVARALMDGVVTYTDILTLRGHHPQVR